MRRGEFIGLSLAAGLTIGATPSPPPDPGDSYFTSGDFERAIVAYTVELNENPQDLQARLRLGELRLYGNDLDGAEEMLQSIPASSQQEGEAAKQLAEIARRRQSLAKRTTIDGGVSEAPFIAVDPLPVLHVRVDGIDAIFLIDTGAPNIVLDPDFASELHLAVTNAGTGVFGGGRHAQVRRTVVPHLDIGGAHADDVSASVLPTRSYRLLPNIRIDGILGTGLFERFLATIDYPQRRLILRPRNAGTSQQFESAAQRDGASIVRCWLIGDHFVFARARVGDAPDGLFLFDSGGAGIGLMASKWLVTAAHLKLDTAHAQAAMGGGGSFESIPFSAPSIAVGNAMQRNVPGSYTPQGSPLDAFPFNVEGIISHLFLKHYAYTVDFTAMKLVLSSGAVLLLRGATSEVAEPTKMAP
jgi:hypothetical protein